jgi:hypothetical protein
MSKSNVKKYRLNEKAWANKQAWKLVNENWTLCHEIVDARDGHKCVICGETRNLQLDHCISRTYKSVFMDTDNLNYLCPQHHTAKSMNPGNPVTKRVDEITRNRMGGEQYRLMIQKADVTCGAWRTVWWQEACNMELKEHLAFVLSVSDLTGWKS